MLDGLMLNDKKIPHMAGVNRHAYLAIFIFVDSIPGVGYRLTIGFSQFFISSETNQSTSSL